MNNQRTAAPTTFRPIPKWERNWITRGKSYNAVEVCRQLDSPPLVRVEPRQGDLHPDYIIPARTLLLWAVVCLAFWGPVAIVVVLFMAGG